MPSAARYNSVQGPSLRSSGQPRTNICRPVTKKPKSMKDTAQDAEEDEQLESLRRIAKLDLSQLAMLIDLRDYANTVSWCQADCANTKKEAAAGNQLHNMFTPEALIALGTPVLLSVRRTRAPLISVSDVSSHEKLNCCLAFLPSHHAQHAS
jgi:hypothetical protein